jgi:uncharacterized repeat protein (TIGR03803 family)
MRHNFVDKQRLHAKTKMLLIAFAAVFGLLTVKAPLFAASTENVLYSFCTLSNCLNGEGPSAGLIFDASGNLYGTTSEGGAYGEGGVFQLVLASGTWNETVLYSFCKLANCTDGEYPTAGLIFDAAGNLYGTTSEGGAYGNGTVFQLALIGGTWNETVLYSFCSTSSCSDGAIPKAGLIFDTAGNLYGTTYQGGIVGCSCGTVFQLERANGLWKRRTLHSFNAKDGYHPTAGLVFDTFGNLYGTTFGGGATGYGTVFELTPTTNGHWKENVLHNFQSNGKDGFLPNAGLIFDAVGNLYGTTVGGGTHGYGTVFELALTDGRWKERPLHSFNENGSDGYYPDAGLILDSASSFYGTTFAGGPNGFGTVFQLALTSGRWKEKQVWSFGKSTDGKYPYAGLILDAAGNLYGTTTEGGAYSGGTVFEVTP